MRELIDIVNAFEQLAAAGTSTALATVAAISGSSYRRPGARMLVARDGRTWGGISGGCLERDVQRRAQLILDTGALPIVCCYETGDDGDIDPADDQAITSLSEPGPSLGCGGQIEILIEALIPDGGGPMAAMAAAVRHRQSSIIATIIRGSSETGKPHSVLPGQRLVRIGDPGSANVSGNISEANVRGAVLDAMNSPTNPSGSLVRLHALEGGWVDVFIEHVLPPQAMVIFGDGHDVSPLVELGKSMGWHVTVVGWRAVAGLRQRFPTADECIFADIESPLAGAIALSANTAVIVMSHNLRRDAAVVAALLKTPPAYLGILGPLRRAARLLADSKNAGANDAPQNTPWLFAPVGLDIGAETAEQVALSIVAEIQAVFSGRMGGYLRDRPGPIHLRGKGETPQSTSTRENFGSCQI